jgi:hypothetical protein
LRLQLQFRSIARDGLQRGGGLIISRNPARNATCFGEVALGVGEYGQYKLIVKMFPLRIAMKKRPYYPSELGLISLPYFESATAFHNQEMHTEHKLRHGRLVYLPVLTNQ